MEKNKSNKIIIVLVVIIIALLVALIATVLLLNKDKNDNQITTKEVLNTTTIIKEEPTAEAEENYRLNGDNYIIKLEYYFINRTNDEAEEETYRDNYKYKILINGMLIKEDTTSIYHTEDESEEDKENYMVDNVIKGNLNDITLSSLTDEATNDNYIVLKAEEIGSPAPIDVDGQLLVINKDYKVVDTFIIEGTNEYVLNNKDLPYVESNRLKVLNTDNIENSILTTYKYENGSKVEVESENIDLSNCGENQNKITMEGVC